MSLWGSFEDEEEPIRNAKSRKRTPLQSDIIREKRLAADVQMNTLSIPKTDAAQALFQEIREKNALRRTPFAPYAKEIRELHYSDAAPIVESPRIEKQGQKTRETQLSRVLSFSQRIKCTSTS